MSSVNPHPPWMMCAQDAVAESTHLNSSFKQLHAPEVWAQWLPAARRPNAPAGDPYTPWLGSGKATTRRAARWGSVAVPGAPAGHTRTPQKLEQTAGTEPSDPKAKHA